MKESSPLIQAALRLQMLLDEEIAQYRQLAFSVATNKLLRCPVSVTQVNLLRYTAYLHIVRVPEVETNITNPVCAKFVIDILLKDRYHDKSI